MTATTQIQENNPNVMRLVAMRSRIHGIDALRYVATFGVVLIHVFDSTRQASTDPGAIINEMARFGVPIFFMTGGFFLAQQKIDRPLDYTIKMAKRLVPVYLVWTVLYNVLLVEHWSQLLNLNFVAIALTTGGLGYHLWFLPAYGICLALTVYLLSKTRFTHVLLIGVALYLLGLAIGSYGGVVFGFPELHDAARLAVAREGPLFGTLFIILGYWLAKSGWRMGLATSAGVFLLGLITSLAEAYWLDAHYYMQFAKNDFLFGTVLMGFGAFCMALGLPPNWPVAAKVGKYGAITLGIYAVHLFFLLKLKALFQPTGVIGLLALGVVVLVLSTTFSVNLKRVPVLRSLVA